MKVPDKWVIVRFTHPKGVTNKVLGSWYGGYLGSDSWQISSGIISVDEQPEYYDITNESGSVYRCYKDIEGMSGYTSNIYDGWQEQAESVEGVKIEIIEGKDYVKQETNLDTY